MMGLLYANIAGSHYEKSLCYSTCSVLCLNFTVKQNVQSYFLLLIYIVYKHNTVSAALC